MCSVTAMMTLTAISTGVSAIGNYRAAGYQADLANYQAGVAENNALVADRMAADARARGSRSEQEHRMRLAQMKSRQRAQFGAGNVDLSSGDALDVLGDTAMLGELDALTIRNNAEREAVQYETQAGNFQGQAGAYRSQSDLFDQAKVYNTMGTILGGSGRVAEQWYKYGRQG